MAGTIGPNAVASVATIPPAETPKIGSITIPPDPNGAIATPSIPMLSVGTSTTIGWLPSDISEHPGGVLVPPPSFFAFFFATHTTALTAAMITTTSAPPPAAIPMITVVAVCVQDDEQVGERERKRERIER
jgi:hypothetical protein